MSAARANAQADPERRVAREARRIVVKVGSSVLTDAGAVREGVFAGLSRQVARLCDEGRQVVLVSSGAIAVGSRTLGWKTPGRSIPEKQAAAAVGQPELVNLYRRRFTRSGRKVAQVLLTRVGLQQRERFLNARHTLMTLLELGVVPIVNENDTVATDEIRFGDNDNLSATVVNLVGADLLILLTDVDGLYPSAPGEHEDAEPFGVVPRITRAISDAAGGSDHAFGRGGMITKLEAARTATRSGAAAAIANGRGRDTLLQVAGGEATGTLFLPGKRLGSRKHWLAFTAHPRGELVLDEGAASAVCERGKSLLPAGIAAVRGDFGIGDAVLLVDAGGRALARGLSAYSAADAERIKGLPTRKIAEVLGYSNGDAVVHRDDLAVVEPPGHETTS